MDSSNASETVATMRFGTRIHFCSCRLCVCVFVCFVSVYLCMVLCVGICCCYTTSLPPHPLLSSPTSFLLLFLFFLFLLSLFHIFLSFFFFLFFSFLFLGERCALIETEARNKANMLAGVLRDIENQISDLEIIIKEKEKYVFAFIILLLFYS